MPSNVYDSGLDKNPANTAPLSCIELARALLAR